jgi:hypothetical protein
MLADEAHHCLLAKVAKANATRLWAVHLDIGWVERVGHESRSRLQSAEHPTASNRERQLEHHAVSDLLSAAWIHAWQQAVPRDHGSLQTNLHPLSPASGASWEATSLAAVGSPRDAFEATYSAVKWLV